MRIDPAIACEWIKARDVIAVVLQEIAGTERNYAEGIATAIIDRLADARIYLDSDDPDGAIPQART